MKIKSKITFLVTIGVFMTIKCFCQNIASENNPKTLSQIYSERLDSLFEKQDAVNQLKLLKSWQIINPNDCDLFLNFSDYYECNGPEFKKAIKYINQGIELNKNRIDLRERKMHLLACISSNRKFVIKEIIDMLNYSVENKNKWKEGYNQDISDGENYMLDIVYRWILKLYNLDNYKNQQVNNILLIAETTLETYPNHFEFRQWLSFSYFEKKEYNKALSILLEDEKKYPDFFGQFQKVAICYEYFKDQVNAQIYYKKYINHLLTFLSKEPDNKELLIEISKIYIKIGDNIGAEKYLEQSKLLK